MSHLLFSTHTNSSLANVVARVAGMRMGRCVVSEYPNKEVYVQIHESVEGKDVFVLGSTFSPAENILQLAIMIDTLKLHGAKSVSVLIPFFAYGRSDRVDKPGVSVSGQVIADIIQECGATRIMTVNIHSTFAEQFFIVPFINMSALTLLADTVRRVKIRNPVIVSPDEGGVRRAREFALALGIADVVTISKERLDSGKVRVRTVSGEVAARDVIIVDDIVETGETMVCAIQKLKQMDARSIYVVAVHAGREGGGMQKLARAREVKKIFVTDTIPPKRSFPKKISVVSVARLFGEAVQRSD